MSPVKRGLTPGQLPGRTERCLIKGYSTLIIPGILRRQYDLPNSDYNLVQLPRLPIELPACPSDFYFIILTLTSHKVSEQLQLPPEPGRECAVPAVTIVRLQVGFKDPNECPVLPL